MITLSFIQVSLQWVVEPPRSLSVQWERSIYLPGPSGLNEDMCVHMPAVPDLFTHTDGRNGSCAAEVFLICSHTTCDIICRICSSVCDGSKNTLARYWRGTHRSCGCLGTPCRWGFAYTLGCDPYHVGFILDYCCLL